MHPTMKQVYTPYFPVSRILCFAAIPLISSQVALAADGAGPDSPVVSVASGAEAGVVSQADAAGQQDEDLISLATVAPGVYSWFNDGLVFGLEGTQTGSIRERTQLTNDWGGLRSRWAESGVFLNLYNTVAYQNVTGGLNPGDAFISNTQLSLDLDTGRLGWWSAGLIHAAIEARHGSSNSKVYGAGTLAPTYYGAVLPQPDSENEVVFTNLFIEQAFGKFGVIAGVIPGLYVPDRTLFGDDWKRFFANYNFNENPLFTQFYNPQTTTLTGSYSPNEQWALSLGVYDPNTDPTDISEDFFSEVNVYGQATYSYEANGLPGQLLFGGLWSNQEKLDLENPLSISDGVNGPELKGNFKDDSWFVNANFSQYLTVIDSAESRENHLARGQPLRGIGAFGRIGYAPEEVSAITQHYSLAMFAHGIWDARPNDTIGFGGYYNKLSGDLKDGVKFFSNGDISVGDERGVEVFYDLEVTPAISINLSYQRIWDPFQATLAGGDDTADLVMLRLSTSW